jgi:uncharacterized protein (TIGR03435 family)
MRLVLALLTAGIALPQTPPRSFEVASVKPAAGGNLDYRILPGGRLHIANLTVNVIVREAYGLQTYEIAGGPARFDTDRFDIEAKAEGQPTKEQMLAMLRALLADRFQPKVRREFRDGNVTPAFLWRMPSRNSSV